MRRWLSVACSLVVLPVLARRCSRAGRLPPSPYRPRPRGFPSQEMARRRRAGTRAPSRTRTRRRAGPDGQLTPLATALFRDQPDTVLNEWRLSMADGALELRFLPDGLRQEQIFLRSLREPLPVALGRFEGMLRLDGEPVKVTGSGVVEQHWATW